MIALGAAILVQKLGGSVPDWFPIVAMVLVVCMYAGGVSPLPYIIMTEMFSFQVSSVRLYHPAIKKALYWTQNIYFFTI